MDDGLTERYSRMALSLRSRLRCVLVANDSDIAESHRASKDLSRDIGTVRMVAEIFTEQFFAPVRSLEASSDRHLRNRESPKPNNLINPMQGVSCASDRLYTCNSEVMLIDREMRQVTKPDRSPVRSSNRPS